MSAPRSGSSRAARTSEPTVTVEVVLVGLPPRSCVGYDDVQAGLQRGDDVPEPAAVDGGELRFLASLRVGDRDGRPNWLGPYAFGTPDDRFLYVVWTGVQGGVRARFRRLKIKLAGADDVVRDAIASGRALRVVMDGTDRDGGPACATRAPREPWRLVQAPE